VLALITPHLDDEPIFAGGTLAKLLKEGYTGYFIRTSDDEKDSSSQDKTSSQERPGCSSAWTQGRISTGRRATSQEADSDLREGR
jgi:LmbE family N-acetylglucosaminyl deacetylase